MVRISVSELKEGYILAEEIVSATKRTIIPKRTVLTEELIEVLQAFLIHDAEIERVMVNGLPVDIHGNDVEEYGNPNLELHIATELQELFLHATRDYMKEFRSWQAGAPVDVSKIRSILLPLIEKMDVNYNGLFQLHHYSTVENYFYQHSVAVGLLSFYIARKTGYDKGDALQVALAGCLSDCGMSKISESILLKKKALTEEEFAEVRQHSVISFKLIQQSPLIRDIGKVAIFQHHERLDGSGYPLGEKSARIHPFAKIIAVADIFHAMTSERLYRNKQSPYRVVEMLLKDMFGQFDIAAIQALQSGLMNVPIGSKLKLSNGQVGEILFIDEAAPTRPLVKISDTGEVKQLTKHLSLFIESIYN